MTPLGAHGSYSNVPALSPAGSVRWYEQIHSDPDKALDVERRIGEFFAEHVAPLQGAGLSNPALDKFLAAVGDWADAGYPGPLADELRDPGAGGSRATGGKAPAA